MRFLIAVIVALFSADASLAGEYDFPSNGSETSVLRIEGSGDIEAIEPLIRDFQSQEPGLRITYVDRLTNELFSALEAQCESGRVSADFVFSSSADHMVKLANDGCAQPHDSAETRRLPGYASWRDEVFGFTFEPAVIVYNRNDVGAADIPRTRDGLVELLRSKPATFEGRIGTYDIARSGIGYLFAFFDAQQSSAFGRLLEGLGRANAKLYCCTGELLDDIAAGRVLIGYNLLGSYAYARMKAGAPIGIVLPRDYTLVLSRAGFIPKQAANSGVARRFLDYLLSLRGQQTAAREAFFFGLGQPLPDGVEAYDPDLQSGVYRPIVIGPALLAVTDEQNRAHMLREWNDIFSNCPSQQ